MMRTIREDAEEHGSIKDDQSDLSSVLSMSRQCTEYTQDDAIEIMSRQYTDFSSRRCTDFWLRKNTEPAIANVDLSILDSGYGRASSCPTYNLDLQALRSQTAPDALLGGGHAAFGGCRDGYVDALVPDGPAEVYSSIGLQPSLRSQTAPVTMVGGDGCEDDAFGSCKDEPADAWPPSGLADDFPLGDGPVDDKSEHDIISRAILAAVNECSFSVCIADPTGLDVEVVAVSPGFEKLTGYSANVAIGENCRFLREECPMQDCHSEAMREACTTGALFNSVVVNRRKTGELFLNLLTMRGLVLASDESSGEELWILIGVQKDVTDMPGAHMQSNEQDMQKVVSRIQKRLVKYAAELGTSHVMRRPTVTTDSSMKKGMRLLANVTWRVAEPVGVPAPAALQALSAVPELVGLGRCFDDASLHDAGSGHAASSTLICRLSCLAALAIASIAILRPVRSRVAI
eukprot:TRINITY_DN21914_c0_g1_i1.p1 TRINITY_DN21914_c0_g1~~TRINITY_DN21914_c0_g1_i1.p1  ORF type:complete len:459 (+),score=74.04 TRINITY_DN21914_c0_g1_i1:78-1454(+)